MASFTQGSASNSTHSVNERVVHLPFETITDILSRLPMKSILKCKSICKAWYSLIQDPHFVNLQLSRTIQQPAGLVLLKTSLNKLLLVDGEGCKIGEINIMEDWFPIIMGSYNGILCVAMVDELDPVLLWNPIVKEYILLPKSESEHPITDHRVDIGFDLSCKKYKVARVYNDFIESNAFKFEIITLGESSWRQLPTPFNVVEIGRRASLFMDGKFYWIIITESFRGWDSVQILILDIVDEKFHTVSLPLNVTLPCEPEWMEWKFLNLGRFVSLTALDFRHKKDKENQHDYQFIHVWQLTRKDVESLNIKYQHTLKLYLPLKTSYNSVISKGNDETYLLKAYGGYNDVPRLVKNYTEKKNHMQLDVPGTCYWQASTSFEPSLISPKQALHGIL